MHPFFGLAAPTERSRDADPEPGITAVEMQEAVNKKQSKVESGRQSRLIIGWFGHPSAASDIYAVSLRKKVQV